MMKSKLVKIGKSKGVCIPPSLLKKSHLTDDVQIEAAEGRITIRSRKRVRQGWAKDFKRMAANGDDELFRSDALLLSRWDETEWQW